MSWLQAPKANQAPGKRPRRDPEKSAASKLDYETKRKRNFLPSWTEKFPWLRYTEEAGEEYMMYCSTCRSLPDIADTETFTQHGQEEMKSLSGFYKELLAKAGITPEEVIAEYAQYKSFALRRSAVPMRDIFLSVLQSEERRAMFRCLCHLMEIYMVLPVSTAVCERGFSTMKRVKTDCRSSLTTAQLQRLTSSPSKVPLWKTLMQPQLPSDGGHQACVGVDQGLTPGRQERGEMRRMSWC
ncbi:Zinc finger protein 862 [Dissostichus eleginoides]|uniref:Zinc finger protein 862 n=1 Tax=Dissostichus eleginoides TaxID=100907 RepID=A0AAD9CM12_DISEL|nr:Zinc finger protein 862 [Dissostichus eleginoides]